MVKNKFYDILQTFIFAILAGVSISIGAVAYLSCENVVVGAIFFCVGLFMVLVFNFNLYTGKLCYVFNNERFYSLKLLIIFVGNFVGTNLVGFLLSLTRLDSLSTRCKTIVDAKLNDSLLSLFILAIFCNILIYVAVEGFKSENVLTKYLSLFFGVSVFVLCGFEHSVADMFYFAFAKVYSGKMFLSLFIIALGNFVGGTLIELLKNFFSPKQKKNLQQDKNNKEE